MPLFFLPEELPSTRLFLCARQNKPKHTLNVYSPKHGTAENRRLKETYGAAAARHYKKTDTAKILNFYFSLGCILKLFFSFFAGEMISLLKLCTACACRRQTG